MKKPFFKTLAAIALSFVGITSCGVDDTAEDAVPRLGVDKNRVELTKVGSLSNGSAPTLSIVANKGYEVTSDSEWLSVDKPTGKGGVTVNILAERNESGEIREGHLTVTSCPNLSEYITVIQNLDEVVDDGKPEGFVYYYDDFAWCVGGDDQIGGGGSPDAARNIYTYTSGGVPEALTKFKSLYDDFNSNGKVVYTMDGYIKFNKTNVQTRITLKTKLPITLGTNTNVELSFDGCAMSGSGGRDQTTVIVEIEGDGKILNGQTDKCSEAFTFNDAWAWQHKTVKIVGINKDTKITIGSSQQNGTSGVFRWFLDNLKIEKKN